MPMTAPDAFTQALAPGVPLWAAVLAAATAAVVLGVAKSGFGGGVGILAVPLTALALDPRLAMGVLLPVLIAADLFAVYQHWGQQSWRHLRPAFIGAAFGIALGTLLLWVFRQAGTLTTALNLTVGGVCLLLVIVQLYRLAGGKVPRIPDRPAASANAGFLSGVVSTLAHSAGPIMSVYLLEHRLDKGRLVGTLVLFFYVVNVAKLPSFIGLGLITPQTLLISAAMAVVVPAGSLLGLYLHRRVAERPFAVVMYTGAAAAAARMIWKGAGM